MKKILLLVLAGAAIGDGGISGKGSETRAELERRF